MRAHSRSPLLLSTHALRLPLSLSFLQETLCEGTSYCAVVDNGSPPQPAERSAGVYSEKQPAEAQPAEAQPAEAQAPSRQPAEAQPAEEQPAEAQPAEAQPAEAQPAEAASAHS